MPQGVLPFKYQEEQTTTGMTALAGLPVYIELAHTLGLFESIDRNLTVREDGQGWSDRQMALAFLLLNLAGGSCVDDLEILEADDGLRRIVFKLETAGLPRKERRKLERQALKKACRALPSPSAARRYLAKFHDEKEEQNRKPHTAFIPKPNQHLKGLDLVNTDLVAAIHARSPSEIATLDQDATIVEADKLEALYCYKGYKGYQPLNVYWAEQDVVLRSEFRDGNVPAGYDVLRVLKEALDRLPEGVKTVYLRADSASYVQALLKYCAEGANERFGTIDFSVSVDITDAFRREVSRVPEEDWHTVYRRDADGKLRATQQQWAEVAYVPAWAGYSKNGPTYRFVAIREPLRQQLQLPGLEDQQLNLPFPTMDFGPKGTYKLSAIVTNRLEMPGVELILWHRERCGKSEAVHDAMKTDLACGRMPSGYFGVNAAWWGFMILAYNLNSALKRPTLARLPVPGGRSGRRGSWLHRRLKALRFNLIQIPGRVLTHARQLIIRLVSGHPATRLLLEVRRLIRGLVLPDP